MPANRKEFPKEKKEYASYSRACLERSCAPSSLLDHHAEVYDLGSQQIQVMVQGSTLMLDVPAVSLALDLELIISKRLGIPRSCFALYHASKKLDGVLVFSRGTMVELKTRGRGGVLHGSQPLASGSVGALFKTKLCRFFSEGKCNKGAKCPYAHGEAELRNNVQGTPSSVLMRSSATHVPPAFGDPRAAGKAAESRLIERTVVEMRAREASQAQRNQRNADARQAQQEPARALDCCKGQTQQQHDENRPFFDKALKTPNFNFKGPEAAQRFAEAMETYADNDLPWRLTRRDEHGLKRMVDAAQTPDVRVAMAMIRVLMHPQWKEDKFRLALHKCVHELFATHALLERITRAVVRKSIETASDLKALSAFGFMITLALGPAKLREQERRDGGVLEKLAQALINACRALDERDPKSAKALREAERLKRLLTREVSASNMIADIEARVTAVADRLHATNIEQWPGGRHSNDYVDFREIGIAPTVEEIFCEERPFLPRADRAERFLAADLEKQLLDRQFRLMREDMIGPVREALANDEQFELQVTLIGLEDHSYWRQNRQHDGHKDGDGPVLAYARGPIGLRFQVHNGGGLTLVELLIRKRQLQVGCLALLKDRHQALAIGRVVRQLRENSEHNPESEEQIGMTFDNDEFVRLLRNKFPGKREVCRYWLRGRCNVEQCRFLHESMDMQLVPLPGSFFAYEPVLKCLQSTQELPFRQELLLQNLAPGPPRYQGACQVLDQLHRQLLRRGVELDDAQHRAFQHATSSQVASIVGPPGCGKSFAGSELARAILTATEQTILVVCYTNHALDQFVCHLLDQNEKRIVRIGGKSKEARLDKFSIHHLKQTIKKTRDGPEKKYIWELHQALEGARDRLHKLCEEICGVNDLHWTLLRNHLETEDPAALRQLSVPTRPQDDFQTVGHMGKRLREDHLWQAWQAGRTPAPFEILAGKPLWRLSFSQRRQLRAEWVEQISKEVEEKLIRDRREFDAIDGELRAFDAASERAVLRSARVIAATTTGAAKYKDLIEFAKPGVLLLEEAGEVLEAHVISSLSASVKHLIMIGDHQQLRPKVETHGLTVAARNGYNLNMSLFERLISGGMAHAVLETQHRMRPEISSIARHMTYPKLRDHASVAGRDSVKGLAANVCFINHTQPENGEAEDGMAFKSLSKVNEFEADMAVQVAQFLLLQGYRTESIVVLTPYLGQLKILSQKFKKHRITATIGERDVDDLLNIGVEQPWLEQIDHSAKGVRTCTIDNYQGEEADLIIVSLVRSNQKGQLGFLGKADAEQRVNVLCTRARLGMIFIGNVNCFQNSSPRSALWMRLLRFLRERGEIFDSLPIKCQTHHEVCQEAIDTPTRLRQWCAEGAGCGRKCNKLLECGHVCTFKCHPWPHDEKMKCEQPVREWCPAGLHRIERACSSRALARCDYPVFEQCQRGHPIVRPCGNSGARYPCGVCRAFEIATRMHEDGRAKDAQEVADMLQKHAQQATKCIADDTQVSEQLRSAAQAELACLSKEHAQRSEKRARQLARNLDIATLAAQNAVREAESNLEERRQRDEEMLNARREEHQRQLQVAEERMAQQRAERRQLAIAEIEKRDEDMRTLHDALAASLAADDEEIAQFNANRPDASKVSEQLQVVRRTAKQVRCSICFDDLTILDGPLCSPLDGHFLCKECFDSHVAEEARKSSFDGHVRCPIPGCTSEPYPGHVIARHATPATFDILKANELALRETENNRKMQQEFDRRLEEERTKLLHDAETMQVEEARKHIVENILTLKCPRCGQAFVDFNGCMALTCSRKGCQCGFCALCLQDCGMDAHAHVAMCAEGTGNVFGNLADYEAAQDRRKTRMVKAYLNQKPAELRQKIVVACENELRGLQ